MEFDWVMWVVGWVGLWVQSFYSVMGCVGLGWVEEIGPMDNSVWDPLLSMWSWTPTAPLPPGQWICREENPKNRPTRRVSLLWTSKISLCGMKSAHRWNYDT